MCKKDTQRGGADDVETGCNGQKVLLLFCVGSC